MLRRLVDFCYLLAAIVLAPLLLIQSYRTGKYRTDWDQRRGFVPQLDPPPGSPPAGVRRPRVWVHAVSVGEVNAVRGIVTAWRERDPSIEIVVSTTTDTGIARARQLFPDLTVFRYPLDFSRFVHRALDRIRPDMVVLVELELWYQFVTIAADRGIPVCIVNGRLSEKSTRMFSRIAPIARRMFSSLTWVGAQDAAYAERFVRMGVPRAHVSITGSVKWDGAEVADTLPGADVLARALGLRTGDPAAPIWVCGSTGPGEEDVILQAFRSVRAQHRGLQLVLVPRKPERFEEVAGLVRRAGFEPVRRSEHPDTAPPAPLGTAVALVDTMGELRKVYTLADVVFVGRSLADMGGSDTMEVAGLGKPMFVGPHNENFADIAERLLTARAMRRIELDLRAPGVAAAVADTVAGMLNDRSGARAMGEAARRVVLENRGATERTLAELGRVLAASGSIPQEPTASSR